MSSSGRANGSEPSAGNLANARAKAAGSAEVCRRNWFIADHCRGRGRHFPASAGNVGMRAYSGAS